VTVFLRKEIKGAEKENDRKEEEEEEEEKEKDTFPKITSAKKSVEFRGC
jgi:hypothetical protein